MLCFQENQNFSMLPRGTVSSYIHCMYHAESINLWVGRTAVREGWEFSIYKWNCWFTWSWKFYYFSRKILGKMREFKNHMTMVTIYYPSKTMANFANMLLNRLKLCYTFKVWTWRKIPLAKLFLCSFGLYLWIINNSLA